MPYITQRSRKELEELYDKFVCDIRDVGEINYILFRYCLEYVKPSYEEYVKFIGELETCKLEIYRRLVATHENKKIRENGDIGCDI